jgi:uncharacterized membrane protein YgcG
MASWVAYVEMGAGVPPGSPVSPLDFSEEDWLYNVQHGNIVREGGPHDPNVLAAANDDEVPDDPKDARIRALELELEKMHGRYGTPAPGSNDADVLGAQQARDDEQSNAEEEAAKDKKSSSGSSSGSQGSSSSSSSSNTGSSSSGK